MWRQVSAAAGVSATLPAPEQAPAVGLTATLERERDRWFLWVPVMLGLGIGLYFQLSAEPPLLLAVAPAVALLVVWWLVRRGTWPVLLASGLLLIALGFALAKVRTLTVAAPVLEYRLARADISGFVEAIEPRPQRGPRLSIRVVQIAGLAAEHTPYRVRVRLMRKADGLAPGQAIRLEATLSPPAEPVIPGDYDFARQAYFQRIGGVGYALKPPVPAPDLGPPPVGLRFAALLSALRGAIGERIAAALPGQSGAIAAALITGERGGISEETNDVYRDSGLFHILSISGLHMVMMGGAVFLFLRLALAAVPSIALSYPVKKWAAAAAMLGALAYLAISGGAYATVRAYVTITVMFLAVLMDRPALALRNVAVSALAILLLFPDSLNDVGFQMSFAAVVALVAVYEGLRERRREAPASGIRRGAVMATALFFGGIVLSTLIASIAVAPFAAYHFHKSQQYAVLANLIAIPVCNVIVMPAALATLLMLPFGLEALPLALMGFGIDIMSWTARAVADLPGAVVRLPAIPDAAFLAFVAGGLWLALWRTRMRWLGLAAIAGAGALAPLASRPDILIARAGQVVAIRTEANRLSAVAAPGSGYELQRWMEHAADDRPLRSVLDGSGYACDATGCTATVQGLIVAVARHPAAAADDCARAAIVVMPFPRPAGCTSAGRLVIDPAALRGTGAQAITIRGGHIEVATVAGVRGRRPWSRDPEARQRARRINPAAGRIAAFASPFALADGESLLPRPETEFEDEFAPELR